MDKKIELYKIGAVAKMHMNHCWYRVLFHSRPLNKKETKLIDKWFDMVEEKKELPSFENMLKEISK